MSTDSASINGIADAIERYLHDHPNAADTIEGIRSWWIAKERRNDPPAQVQSALDLLVGNGRLCCTLLPDGTMIYARPRQDHPRQGCEA